MELPLLEKIKAIIVGIVKSVIPRTLLDVLLDAYPKGPIMECYGIKQEDLVKFLKENGAKIIDISEDQGTPGWISFRYCVTKE